MRARIWIFTAVVTLALALNLARVSLSIAQTGEDTLRARVAAASTALRGQLDLLDARLAPRSVAMMPDLVEAMRGGDGQAATRPDERALRAAGAVLAPEPDLFAVVNAQGAVVSRRVRPVQILENPTQLPLSQAANGAMPPPSFAAFDNTTYRFAAARVPGATAAAVVGTLVDDRFAAQLKSQVDADVTLLQGGRVLASSLPQGEERTRVVQWAAAPGPGYGVLQIRLPLIGTALSGKLPRGTSRYAVRGALLPIDGGVQAALTVPASPYLAWLGRYQAFYLVGLALLVLFGFVWGLFARQPAPVIQQVAAAPEPAPEPDDGVVGPPRRAPRSRPQVVPEATPSEPPPLAVEPRKAEAAAPEAAPLETAPPEAAPPETASHGEPLPESALIEAAAENAAAPEAEPAAANPDDSAVWGSELPPPQEEAPFASETAAPQQPVPDWDMPPPAPAALAQPDGQGDSGLAEALDPSLLPPEQAPAPDDADPDESHWRETYDQFCELKLQLGESAERISFEKFAAKLRKNRTELVARHNCKGVRFSVYEKDGKAAIKASAIR